VTPEPHAGSPTPSYRWVILVFAVLAYATSQAARLNYTGIQKFIVEDFGLDKAEQYQQKPAFEDDRRLFAALKWEPRLIKTGLTQFQISYEDGRTESNRPRPTPPHRYTPRGTSGGEKSFFNVD